MSSPYDENLLASAPKATKAQLQDGYNPDLLVENTSSTPTTPLVDSEVAKPAVQREEVVYLTKKKPFYATKKGIIIIVVLVVVIIAVVVGGAVGGTRNKKSVSIAGNSVGPARTSTASTASSSPGSPQGPAGPVNSTSTGTHNVITPTSSQVPAPQGPST